MMGELVLGAPPTTIDELVADERADTYELVEREEAAEDGREDESS